MSKRPFEGTIWDGCEREVPPEEIAACMASEEQAELEDHMAQKRKVFLVELSESAQAWAIHELETKHGLEGDITYEVCSDRPPASYNVGSNDIVVGRVSPHRVAEYADREALYFDIEFVKYRSSWGADSDHEETREYCRIQKLSILDEKKTRTAQLILVTAHSHDNFNVGDRKNA